VQKRPVAHELEVTDLKRCVAMLKRERAAHLSDLQSSKEHVLALEDTVKLLRSKLHSQGQREVDNMRRLAVHQRLEPVFDKLGEMFTFKDPMEIVDRLEFLEDGHLDACVRLTETQLEVQAVQAELRQLKASRAAEQAKLHEQHAQVLGKLQDDKERLEAEYGAAQEMVRQTG
jgi:hypothetical protein